MSTDCIVIKIEEYSKCYEESLCYQDSVYYNNYPVKTMYILYDEIWDSYVIRGEKCNDCARASYYSFSCKKINSLIAFIQMNFDFTKRCDLTLYNYNDLPYDTDYITFDLLNKNSLYTSSFVIAIHKNIDDRKKGLKKTLKILKNVINIYEESELL